MTRAADHLTVVPADDDTPAGAAQAFAPTPEDRARIEAIRVDHLLKGRVRTIAKAVATDLGLPVSVIVGTSRNRLHVEARQMVMFMAYQRGSSLAQIGQALGRDHTTVLHGIRAEAARRRQAFEAGQT